MFKARFFISLAVILLISWADVFFAGTGANSYLPIVLHQPIHFIALLITMFIGFLNWKDYPEKWLTSLWLFAYSLVIAVLGLSAAFYLLHIPYSISFVKAAIYFRNRFTWPLPFIVCYMLHLASRYIVPGRQ